MTGGKRLVCLLWAKTEKPSATVLPLERLVARWDCSTSMAPNCRSCFVFYIEICPDVQDGASHVGNQFTTPQSHAFAGGHAVLSSSFFVPFLFAMYRVAAFCFPVMAARQMQRDENSAGWKPGTCPRRAARGTENKIVGVCHTELNGRFDFDVLVVFFLFNPPRNEIGGGG